eukprot:c2801_g1_i1.p1 GENE.c2801_g1_i1~~c2801_g1_i1.p1  ORF type:complete len:271 (-),score=40.64 c2801_g1_i1:382-1095(-)
MHFSTIPSPKSGTLSAEDTILPPLDDGHSPKLQGRSKSRPETSSIPSNSSTTSGLDEFRALRMRGLRTEKKKEEQRRSFSVLSPLPPAPAKVESGRLSMTMKPGSRVPVNGIGSPRPAAAPLVRSTSLKAIPTRNSTVVTASASSPTPTRAQVSVKINSPARKSQPLKETSSLMAKDLAALPSSPSITRAVVSGRSNNTKFPTVKSDTFLLALRSQPSMPPFVSVTVGAEPNFLFSF